METIKSVIGMTLAIAWLLFAGLNYLIFWGMFWLLVASPFILLLLHIFN
jgi:hypothetical protein